MPRPARRVCGRRGALQGRESHHAARRRQARASAGRSCRTRRPAAHRAVAAAPRDFCDSTIGPPMDRNRGRPADRAGRGHRAAIGHTPSAAARPPSAECSIRPAPCEPPAATTTRAAARRPAVNTMPRLGVRARYKALSRFLSLSPRRAGRPPLLMFPSSSEV